MKQTDYLIIGAGIAGLCTALHLKDAGQVTIITKGKLKQNNSYWAQGGVASVLTKEDSFEKHIQDTIAAGSEHNDPAAVRFMVENAPKAIRFLQEQGVRFKEDPMMEGAHSEARVWQTSDFTGQDIMNQLFKKVQKARNIKVEENTDAVELIVKKGQCKGAFVRIGKGADLQPFLAKHTVLATGGIGQLFEKTSNALAAGGDGWALAVNAGLDLVDIEFVQFHPTALDRPDNGRYFLLSEALRGFGAKVVNAEGKLFLNQYDKRAELAPRDLVTRAIHFEKDHGPVYLKLDHLNQKELYKKFPNITKRLKSYGFDVSKDLIPITPVVHFACGGVPTDLHGATKLPGLYAVGEVAFTGVHGANRLASNALLEALVFSEAVARTIIKAKPLDEPVNAEDQEWDVPQIVVEEMPQVIAYAKRIGQVMWEHAGVVRDRESMEEGLKEIASIPARDYRIQHRQIACYHILKAAMERLHSLGCHYINSKIDH